MADNINTIEGTEVFNVNDPVQGSHAITLEDVKDYVINPLDVYGDALINTLTVGKGAGDIATNTALGYRALNSNTTGEYSVAIGESALKNNTTGLSNTAIGYQALFSNTTGNNNNAIGLYALYSNTTGYENIANGFYSLHGNIGGFHNISIGFRAMQVNTTGSKNVAIGWSAGRYITGGGANQTSSNSLYLGYNTRASANGNTNEIVIGYIAEGLGSNTATIGNSSVTVLYLAGAVGWFQGNGTPEGVVTAPVGSFYSRKDGGAGTSFYVKESGSGNTGWIGK
jgi:hypothetical protein